MDDYFNEQYEVILDYQLPDGYWACGHAVKIEVKCKHGVNEKNNHGEAIKKVNESFPGCTVKKVLYC